MKWQAQGGDPKISEAVENFKKLTGLDIQTDFRGKGKAGLKTDYVEKIRKVFETIKKHINIKSYTPPDGQRLKVKVEGAGNWAKGLYYESTKTIAISPTWPGTVVHEIGHYFWYRHPELQREFLKWANESGYSDQVTRYTMGRFSKEEVENHIDSTFANYQRRWNDYATGLKDSSAVKGRIRLFRRGCNYLMNVARELMKDHEGEMKPSSMKDSWEKALDVLKKGDKKVMSTMAVKMKSMYRDVIPDNIPVSEVEKALGAVGNVISKAPDIKARFLNFLTGASEQSSRDWLKKISGVPSYSSKWGYWTEGTEKFARAFETFMRYKENIKEGGKDDPYGYGHGKMDPDWSMFKDRKFERMIKKHIGTKVIKSLAIMVQNNHTRLVFPIKKRPVLVLAKGKALPVGAVTTYQDGSRHKKVSSGKWVQISKPKGVKEEKTVKMSIGGHEYEQIPKSQWKDYFVFISGKSGPLDFKVSIPRKNVSKVIKKYGHKFLVHRKIEINDKGKPYLTNKWEMTEAGSGLAVGVESDNADKSLFEGLTKLKMHKDTLDSIIESGMKYQKKAKLKELPKNAEPEWMGGYHEDEKHKEALKKLYENTKFAAVEIKNWAKGQDVYLGNVMALYSMDVIEGAIGNHMAPDAYVIYMEEKKKAEEANDRERKEEEEIKVDNVSWDPDTLDAIAKWVNGSSLRSTRIAIKKLDNTITDQDYISEEITKRAKLVNGQMKTIRNVNVLWRGTNNMAWKEARPGDEIPFGMGSFSKNEHRARGFGSIILRIEPPPPFYGIDIDKLYRDHTSYKALMRRDATHYTDEEEVLLRATHLKVTSEPKQEENRYYVTVKPVIPEKIRMRKAKPDRKALLEKMSAEFDKPLHRKPKRHRKKK